VPSAFGQQTGHAAPPVSATLSWTSRIGDTFGPGDGKTRTYSVGSYNFDVGAADVGGISVDENHNTHRDRGLGPSNVNVIVGSKDPAKFKNPDLFLGLTTQSSKLMLPGTYTVKSSTGTQTGTDAAASIHFTPAIGTCSSTDTAGTFTVLKAAYEVITSATSGGKAVFYHPLALQIHFDLRCTDKAGVFTGDFTMSDKPISGAVPFVPDASTDTGDDGGTPTPGATPLGPLVVLPDTVIATPPVMANSTSITVPFTTFIPSTVTGPVTLSVTTDADNLLASVSPTTIQPGGSGNGVLTIRTTETTFAGDHAVTITATDGVTPSSATVFVTVICDPPFILGIDQPKSFTVSPGRPALLSVKASGSGPFTYQWFTGSTGLVNFPLAGGTTPNFTTSALNDTTQYWVRVTNPCGSADSQTATINVSAGAKPARR